MYRKRLSVQSWANWTRTSQMALSFSPQITCFTQRIRAKMLDMILDYFPEGLPDLEDLAFFLARMFLILGILNSSSSHYLWEHNNCIQSIMKMKCKWIPGSMREFGGVKSATWLVWLITPINGSKHWDLAAIYPALTVWKWHYNNFLEHLVLDSFKQYWFLLQQWRKCD